MIDNVARVQSDAQGVIVVALRHVVDSTGRLGV
jgi:hypothetical protein